MARSVNFVWNYINELSSRSIKERGTFLSAYDIHPYTKGAGKELGLHSQSLQCIAAEYVNHRKQFKKARLNWRKSRGVRRSLGWIPVNTHAAQWKNGQVFHNGHYFSVWDSFGLRTTNSVLPVLTKIQEAVGISMGITENHAGIQMRLRRRGF